MIFRSVIIACVFGALALPARAGDLSVTVTTRDGKPLADAVVTLPASPGAPKPNFPWKPEIAQKDKQFIPFVLVTSVGTEVAFPNLDKFRHHVYSFSKSNPFELELYGREDKRSWTFKNPGTAALGCNIHDQMVAFVRVVDTPWAAKTDMTGAATITNAPDGATKLTVWHPYAKSKDQTVTTDVTVAPGATRVTIAIDVTAAAMTMHH